MLLLFSDVRCDDKALWDRNNGLRCGNEALRDVVLLPNGLVIH